MCHRSHVLPLGDPEEEADQLAHNKLDHSRRKLGNCLLYVRMLEDAAGIDQQQKVAFIGTVSFSYQVAFSFLRPMRKDLGQGVVKYLVHDPELSKPMTHINLLDLSQANGERSSFPPYTWELEGLLGRGDLGNRIL